MLGKKADAYTSVSGANAIGNLYNESDKTFNIENLNKLASKAGFSSFVDMVEAAKNGTVKTAADFGSATVKLGSFNTLQNTKNELSWIPVYLSESDSGDAILTLWLANTSNSNDVSNQEVGSFTEGTEKYQNTLSDSNAMLYSENGENPVYVFSNNYDSSYLRHWVVLGGSDNYIENWGQVYNVRNKNHGAASHPQGKIIPYLTGVEEDRPDQSTLTKFSMFQNSGELERFLVTPSNMPWQMNLGGYRNDPNYAAGGAPGFVDYGKYHTNYWVNDKVWIPSTGEVYATQYSSGTACDGGLWNTSADQRDNSVETWLRTAVYWTSQVSTQICENLTPTGGSINKNADISSIAYQHAVRPSIHLNLSKLNVVKTPEITGEYTYNRTEQTVTFKDFDVEKMEITGIARTTTLPSAGGYTAATYTNVAAGSPSGTQPVVKFTEAGEYKITLKSKPVNNSTTDYWLFSDSGEETTTITLKVNREKLSTPSFGTGAAVSKEYNGSEYTFTASGYPNANVTGYPRSPLGVSISNDGGALSPQPSMTETSSGTLEVKMRNAGNYNAGFTISDTVNYEWSDGTQTKKEVPFTVTKKALTLSYTTTENNVWGWAADSESSSGTITVSGIFNGDGTQSADSVNLKLEISDTAGGKSYITGVDNGDGTYTFTVDKDISVFGGSYTTGTYYLKPVLSNGTAGTHDGNYELSTALSGLNNGSGYKLVIGTAGAGLPSYSWTYTEDGGTDQALPADGKLTYKFNGSTTTGVVYELTVDTTDFASAYIAIDTSKYDNGYKNRSASVAGKYVTTVALKTTDGDHTFPAPGGGTSTTSEITIEWEIEKAKYDFTNVKWQYTDTEGNTKNYPARWDADNGVWEYLDENGDAAGGDAGIPWYGENYTLTLTGLPTGVTITNPTGAYTGNKEKFISANGYTAECTGVSGDSANYESIPSGLLSLDWKIVKGKVVIRSSTWTTSQQGSDSNVFYVPTLQNVSGVEYEYYDLGTTANSPGPGTKLDGLDGVTSVLGTKHYYYVKAVVASGVSSDGVTLWIDAIEIVDETDPEPKYGACTKSFETGDNRTAVQITLSGAPYTYDGKTHGELKDGNNGGELEIKVGSNAFPTSRFTVQYYVYDAGNAAEHYKGELLGGAPKDAGRYVIEIKLTATAEEDYYATDEYFDFEIKPYVLDMSQVKWGYLVKDENGAEIEVEYNPSSPMQFGLDENGNAIKHNVILIGLPKGDKNGDAAEQLLAQMYEESGLGNDGSDGTRPQVITYSGSRDETAVATGGTSYKTKAVLAGLGGNFKFGSLPAMFAEDAGAGGYSSTQEWKVEPKKINAPKDDDTHSFTGETLDILTYAGLNPEELGLYYEITAITYYDANFEAHTLYTNPHAAGNPQRPTESEMEELREALAGIKAAGTYMVTARLIDSNNVKFLVNGVAGTAPSYLAQIEIQKMRVTVTGWTNPSTPKNNTPWEANYESTFPTGLIENKITDESGKEVSESEWMNGWNKTFYQTLRPTAGNEENIEIVYAEGVEEEKSFNRGDEEGVIYGEIEKPTYTGATGGTVNENGVMETTFNGVAQKLMPSGMEELLNNGRLKLYAVDEEGNETEVGGEYFSPTNAGKYKVIARINGNFKWKDSKDKSDLIFEFEVKKAQVKAEWDTSGKEPVLKVPEEYAGYVEYEYRDETGKVLTKEELKSGKNYTVTAKVKNDQKGNVEFLFTDLEGNEMIGSELETQFELPGGLFGLPEDFPLWQIIVITVCLILFIVFMILAAKNRKEKKEAEKEIKKYQDSLNDLDDLPED